MIYMQREWMRQEQVVQKNKGGTISNNFTGSSSAAKRAAVEELQARLREKKKHALEYAANVTKRAEVMALLRQSMKKNADDKSVGKNIDELLMNRTEHRKETV
jgi:hypothetical protein